MRPLLAHCRLGLGLLYGRWHDRAPARAELVAALELFQAMDMGLWVSRAAAALAEVA